MNWQTGLIGSATEDHGLENTSTSVSWQRRHAQKTCRASTSNTWGSDTFGTPQITPKASLSGNPLPYMNYGDVPVHPRLNMWFGPLTMLGFISLNSDILDYNWFAGTTAEAQTWQLKAGIRAALDDINKNHPNDHASVNFWSSHNGYNTARVPMGRDYDKMKNALYYPYSLLGSLGTVTNEVRPTRMLGRSAVPTHGFDHERRPRFRAGTVAPTQRWA